eukprot:Hpha_TRINITY_DN14066_c0_g1::TRINITY_DN14066_c0_g1_i2::g.43927::m.43927
MLNLSRPVPPRTIHLGGLGFNANGWPPHVHHLLEAARKKAVTLSPLDALSERARRLLTDIEASEGATPVDAQPPPMGEVPDGETMKVWTHIDPSWTWGPRIGGALADFAPRWVQFVLNPEEADVRLVHIVGHTERRRVLKEPHPPFVAIQHVIRTAAGEIGVDD